MMGVDDLGARDRARKGGRDVMSGMPVQPGDGAQRATAQAAWFDLAMRVTTEADQLTVDVASQGSCQLHWVAFAAAE